MSKSPVFIVGNMRSGTTMLRLMLTSHRNIAVPPEGGFVVLLGWKYGYRDMLLDQDVKDFVEELFEIETTQDWELDKNALLRRLAKLVPCPYPTLVEGVYKEYISQKFLGKKRWGDKTTWYLDYLHQIDQYFPEAKYVHIIRDGRAVAASFKRVPHLDNEMEKVAFEWVWGIRNIIRFGKRVGPERYLKVKYEQLVEKPEEELQRICRFVEEPYDDQMLDFWRKNRQQKLEPERHLVWKALTLEKVTTTQLARWQEDLTKDEIAIFWSIAGNVMTRLGYKNCEFAIPAKTEFYLKTKKLIDYTIRATRRRLRPWKTRVRSQFR